VDSAGIPGDVGDAHADHDDPQRNAQSDAVADADPGSVRGDSGRERVDRGADHTAARSEEDDRGRDDAVVAEREREGYEEHEEPERLLPHPVSRPADREDRHQDRDQHRAAVAEAQGKTPDPGLDRLRLHRHSDERADRENEQEDRRRPVQQPLFPGPDEAISPLDPVEPVRRRVPQHLEPVAERGIDTVDARLGLDLGTRRGLRVGGGDPRLRRRLDIERLAARLNRRT
jgi:hypothetical protein